MRGAPCIWELSGKKPAWDLQTSPEFQDLVNREG